VVRLASAPDDFRSAAELLDRFNREFDCPTPGPGFLATRVAELAGDDSVVLLAADQEGDRGVAVVRFRRAIWSEGLEAYLAELYVVPESRRRGLGGELMEAVLAAARERGCDTVDLGTDEGDHDAHRLYERFGFSNLVDADAKGSEPERMLFYEREL
jgi:GNAT superfamily N-acetyltransferase